MPTEETALPLDAESLAESLRWTRFRRRFADALAAGLAADAGTQVDEAALARAFWDWVGVLEHDAAFEALDPVDHAHFAAGQLLARLLTHRPITRPALPVERESRVLAEAVLDQLGRWRRAHGVSAPVGLPVDPDSAVWASFLENTAAEPELAIAFLDEFTGREPVWRYPQLIAERPAMRKARRSEAPPA